MQNEMMARAETVMANTYQRYPLVITRGRGATVWDEADNAYIDFVAGIAVCNLGHAHPRIAKALAQQAETLLHVSNLYYTVPQISLAARLVERSFADKVFFCNSGAEANEAAIKLARRYFYEKGEPGRFRILTMELSFHGRTMATLSATGQEKIKKGFDPVLEGFEFVPFNDIQALKDRLDASVCAVMLEPIQGEGGIRCPGPDYLQQVRELCDRSGALMILDEIQTGIGRTGRLFAYEHFGIEPDIMTLAKALGNGLPIGAMLAREQVAQAFGIGSHATTFGGTPVITAAAMETLNVLDEENLLEHCREIGGYFEERLHGLKKRHPHTVEDIRGMGLLLGMKLKIDGGPIVNACMQKGFLINCVQGNILRFVPPLIIDRQAVDALVAGLDDLL